jgi:hypothetical protein
MRQGIRILVALVYVVGYTPRAQVKNFDIFGNFLFSLMACQVLAMVHRFIFQRTPETLPRGIVPQGQPLPATALTAHGRPHAKLGEFCLIAIGEILATTVRM